MRFIFMCMLGCVINQAHAMSNPYRGGEVGILIKNDRPCFYISEPLDSGTYSLVILTEKQVDSWTYLGSFEKNRASKDSCILWEKNLFSNKSLPILNTPYNVTLGIKKKAYNSDFCLAQKEGQTVVQEVKNNKCYEPPKGMW